MSTLEINKGAFWVYLIHGADVVFDIQSFYGTIYRLEMQ